MMISIDDLNKKPDFKLPNAYFEKMQDEVFAKIHQYEKKFTQRKIFYIISSMAASLLIIFIVYFLPKENFSKLTSLISGEKEMQIISDNIVMNLAMNIENVENLSNKVSVKQRIKKIELDNLDYSIIEYYEESIYDLALLDSYYY